MANLSKLLLGARKALSDNSPELLTALGSLGVISTAVLAVKGAPEAYQNLYDLEDELKEEGRDPNLFEVFKVMWKPYMPAAAMGTVSIACIIGANRISAKRNVILAGLYSVSEATLHEYKDKVVEMFGEKKAQTVRDSINKDRLEKNEVSKDLIHATGNGATLCYDTVSGRYFLSTIEHMRAAANDLNEQMFSWSEVSLNDLYDKLDLPTIKMGDEIGWNINRSIKMEFSTILVNEEPCIVMDFVYGPHPNFRI